MRACNQSYWHIKATITTGSTFEHIPVVVLYYSILLLQYYYWLP
jgi:hypothetical protein